MSLLDRIQKQKPDLSPLGLILREDGENYYCTPEGARVFGWAGADGIHFCTVPRFGDMIFAVSPMNAPDPVHPIAESFDKLLALLLSCGDTALLEQCYAWDREQYEACLQDRKMTPEQEALLEQLRKEFGLKPVRDVFGYVKKLQRSFDYTEIPYTEDYYDPDMNPDAPQRYREWAVSYAGGFWGNEGSVGEEVKLGSTFRWGSEKWTVPSAYLCREGLVLDLCAEIDKESLKAFLEKWKLLEEGPTAYSEAEQEAIRNEQPTNISFRSQAVCNGKKLETDTAWSLNWIPASCRTDAYVPEPEAVQCAEHYGLDPDRAWVLWRCSYAWNERESRVESLELSLEREAVRYRGRPIGRLETGDRIEIENPVTGQKYKLSVTGVFDEALDRPAFHGPGMEYPTHFQLLTYRTEPETDQRYFTLQDAREGDPPRMKKKKGSGPTACAAAVIGGAQALSAIDARNTKTVCSSLHFSETFEAEWVPVFYMKGLEDIRVGIRPAVPTEAGKE